MVTYVFLLTVGLFFGIVSAIQTPTLGNVWVDLSHQVHTLFIWVIQALVIAALLKYVFGKLS